MIIRCTVGMGRVLREKGFDTQGSIRYRVGPGTDAMVAVAGSMALFLLAGIIMSPEAGPVLLFLLATAFLLVLALLRLITNITTVEIDTAAGLVRKTEGAFFGKKLKTYSLRNIDAVRLIEKDVIVEEGYGVTSYTIILESNNESQELFTTNDELQGWALYRELAALTSRQRTD